MVLAGLITRKGILLVIAAATAMLKVACLVSALVVFFVKTMLLFESAHISDTDIEVMPTWSFYLGGAGVLFYFFGAGWLFILGIVMTMVMEGQGRNGLSFGTELSDQANAGDGYNYNPLTTILQLVRVNQ